MASIEVNTNAWPIRDVLPTLLLDRTTKTNIIFATESYADMGSEYGAKKHIEAHLLTSGDRCFIQPRVMKGAEEQVLRTRKKAEVFTPAWVCCLMINALDEDWFGRPDVFGQLNGQEWVPQDGEIELPKRRRWQTYVDSRILEITCGEAPYIVSRYDMGTGEIIPIKDRIGILDRKLRIVNENAGSEEEWLKWTLRAYQAVYGYEYQGDNLLIARFNLLLTFTDYMQERWGRQPSEKELNEVAKVISWNIWQMDGLKAAIPIGALYEEYHQMTLFEMFQDESKAEDSAEHIPCRIYDWRGQNKSIEFNAFQEGRNGSMKFNYIIGNPPYQEEDGGAGVSATPVYNKFVEAVKKLDPKSITLIMPAKWYSGGKGLDDFRKTMLNDKHICRLIDFTDSKDCFPGVDVAGGVCVFVRNKNYEGECSFTNYLHGNETSAMRNLAEYDTFIRYPIAADIVRKVVSFDEPTLASVVSSRKPFGLPTTTKPLSRGDIQIRYNGGIGPFMSSQVPAGQSMINQWKIIISRLTAEHAGQPDKSGRFRVLSTMEKLSPGQICSETYLVAGAFDTEKEADNYAKYLKTKFVRFLIIQKAMTQQVSKAVFGFVPVQDFRVVHTDADLYLKYQISDEEVQYIESMIKEME